jgi:hypothetical protein
MTAVTTIGTGGTIRDTVTTAITTSIGGDIITGVGDTIIIAIVTVGTTDIIATTIAIATIAAIMIVTTTMTTTTKMPI